MEHLCDILLFGTMGEIGPEVQTILCRHGLRVSAAPFPQNVFRDEPGYRRGLFNAIVRCRPRIILPIGDTLAMARFKGLIDHGEPLSAILGSHRITEEEEEAVKNARIAVESEGKIRLLGSKVQSYMLAESLSIPQPKRYENIADIRAETQIVFKRDISFGGHGVHLPKSMEALNNLIGHQSPGEAYLIEEFIEGSDYSLDAVRTGTGMESSGYLCHKPKGNGPAIKRTILPEGDAVLAKMRQSAAAILDHIDYRGVCGMDFRANGDVMLLECNPRFTGGVAAQAAAGFDIPYLLYNDTNRQMRQDNIS